MKGLDRTVAVGRFLRLKALSLCPYEGDALSYAQASAQFRSREIRALDSTGNVERTIAFNEADRKL